MSNSHSNSVSESLPKNYNRLFWFSMCGFGAMYLALIVAMVVADYQYANLSDLRELLSEPSVRFSVWLSLITCTISAILSMWVAIPTGYVLARVGRGSINRRFANHSVARRCLHTLRYAIDTLLDIPIVLPPLVVGISLLVLFQTRIGRWIDATAGSFFAILGIAGIEGITYEIPAIILAQFTVAAAFAIRTMRDTFEQISPRPEQIATTLGASHYRAFANVALPQSKIGCVAAFTLAWARSLGEFGPILIFAGTTRMKTEVLSTTVYLNFQMGNLKGAVAASLLLLTLAIFVLLATRFITLLGISQREVIA